LLDNGYLIEADHALIVWVLRDEVILTRHPNDRLLLGMKGTMSELELSILRQRSLEALKQKARRGELFLTALKLRPNVQ
jgi:DNA invertase Pin-like site-specific DNA recombinase